MKINCKCYPPSCPRETGVPCNYLPEELGVQVVIVVTELLTELRNRQRKALDIINIIDAAHISHRTTNKHSSVYIQSSSSSSLAAHLCFQNHQSLF